MVPNGIKIGKQQLNVLAYAYDFVLSGKNEVEIRQLFVEIENIARKSGLQINQGKTKYMIVEWKNSSKQNKIRQITKAKKSMYTFERVKDFKYLGVILNEEIDLQERIKNANRTHFRLQKFF